MAKKNKIEKIDIKNEEIFDAIMKGMIEDFMKKKIDEKQSEEMAKRIEDTSKNCVSYIG